MSTPSVTRPSKTSPTNDDKVDVNAEIEENAQDQSEDRNLKNKRKLTLKIRNDLENGERIVKCNHCERSFMGKGYDGTTHLKKIPKIMSLKKA